MWLLSDPSFVNCTHIRPAQLWVCTQNSWEMGMGMGQASFLFHTISSNFKGQKCWKIKKWWGGFHFTFKKRWEMWNGCNVRVNTIRGQGISFYGPVKIQVRQQEDTDLNPKLCWLYVCDFVIFVWFYSSLTNCKCNSTYRLYRRCLPPN